jgi:hypothetical protein
MPRFAYDGCLWGYRVLVDEGEKVLCRACFRDAKHEGRVIKVIHACGTEDLDDELDHVVYLCDSDRCFSDSAPYAGESRSI